MKHFTMQGLGNQFFFFFFAEYSVVCKVAPTLASSDLTITMDRVVVACSSSLAVHVNRGKRFRLDKIIAFYAQAAGALSAFRIYRSCSCFQRGPFFLYDNIVDSSV